MKKWVSLLVMVVLVLSLAGCQKSPEEDAATVVAEVNGATITKGEATEFYNQILLQNQYVAQMYGMAFDPEDKSTISSIKAETLTMLTQNMVLEQKLEELGLGLTEEETADLEAQAQQERAEEIANISNDYGITLEEADELLVSQGFSQSMITYSLRQSEIISRLEEYTGADVTVTEEEIQEEYDSRLQTAKETYQDDPSQYAVDVSNGTLLFCRPEGYRNIKNLVITFPEETQTQLNTLSDQIYEASYYAYMYDTQISMYGTSMDANTLVEYTDLKNTYEQQAQELQEEYDALVASGQEEIRAHAEEVLALCQQEGADFDALMAEYNGDTATGTLVTEGYPVCADNDVYVEAFTEGAMALENPGDISGLIASDYGFHILFYASDVEAGDLPLEGELYDALSGELLAEKKETAYNDACQAWIDEADIKTYVSKL